MVPRVRNPSKRLPRGVTERKHKDEREKRSFPVKTRVREKKTEGKARSSKRSRVPNSPHTLYINKSAPPLSWPPSSIHAKNPHITYLAPHRPTQENRSTVAPGQDPTAAPPIGGTFPTRSHSSRACECRGVLSRVSVLTGAETPRGSAMHYKAGVEVRLWKSLGLLAARLDLGCTVSEHVGEGMLQARVEEHKG